MTIVAVRLFKGGHSRIHPTAPMDW